MRILPVSFVPYLRLVLGRLLREIGWLRLALLGSLLALGLLQALAVLGPHPLGRRAVPVLLASSRVACWGPTASEPTASFWRPPCPAQSAAWPPSTRC